MGPQYIEEVEKPGQCRDAEAGGQERKQESGFLGLWGPLHSWTWCPQGPPGVCYFWTRPPNE